MSRVASIAVDPMKHLVLKVKLPRALRLRVWVGFKLVTLAARIMGVQVEMDATSPITLEWDRSPTRR